MKIQCLPFILWTALGCSYVEVPVPDEKAPNGTKYVIGRTNELGGMGLIRYRIAAHPRGEHGGKYGHVAVEGQLIKGPPELWIAADGMNEMGLSIGAQTLREAKYQTPSLQGDILSTSLISVLLRHCADVEEAVQYLSKRRVIGPMGEGTGFHWAMADASGRSVVLEYLKGERVVWENPTRVMTNDPPMDWHWRNLNNYANLSPYFPHMNDFLHVDTAVGVVPRGVGHGINLAGLPGDSTPPARFVQLFYLRGFAIRDKKLAPKTVDDAIVLASGLLNRVFIPHGILATDNTLEDKVEGPEFTPFALLKIPSERRMLVRAYRNLRWRQVDLTKLDWSKSYAWPVEDGTLGIEDLTPKSSEQVSV